MLCLHTVADFFGLNVSIQCQNIQWFLSPKIWSQNQVQLPLTLKLKFPFTFGLKSPPPWASFPIKGEGFVKGVD